MRAFTDSVVAVQFFLDMIEYLHTNLGRVQSEYKDMLQQVPNVPPRRSSTVTVSSDLSGDAASYLARMKARSSHRSR